MSLDNPNKINHYISQTIYESELLAEKDAKKEIKLSIESNNTDEMKMVIAEYSQINNPYKLLNSEFELKVKDPYNFLNDTDRLNFIADEIADNFNYQFLMVDTGKDARRLYNQIDNIQDVVYSTKKLKIKSETFQKYLKTKIKPQESSVEGKPKNPRKKPKYKEFFESIDELALYLFYIEEEVTKSNNMDFGKKWECSGHKLYQKFNRYRQIGYRTRSYDSIIKDRNHKNRLENVKNVLPDGKRVVIETDLKDFLKNSNWL
ncbi:hypothetical protein [Mesoflavibacter zeaxanthinifaciens]|uniref:hypothetical protein n=1 Tax=Mesoflavibacter zeaxanthinifaciens TaxID=393060 RepID=UPI00040B172E|nr:hypothetical protein [Mesoflavibacter zeaxanthinifaciens]